MYEQVIVWVGFALLLVLCLPFVGVRKLVLRVYGVGLRLALLALLSAAGYLWFRPEQLPSEVTDTLNNFPLLRALLPEPGTASFAICAAALVVGMFLPLLAVLDVCRQPARRRQRRQRRQRVRSTEPEAKEAVVLSPVPQRGPSPVLRRIDGRAAADTMAEAGSRKLSRPVNRLEQ
jgi:hypothetical protein